MSKRAQEKAHDLLYDTQTPSSLPKLCTASQSSQSFNHQLNINRTALTLSLRASTFATISLSCKLSICLRMSFTSRAARARSARSAFAAACGAVDSTA